MIQLELPCQRWNHRRDSYRPAGEVIRTADYEVAFLDGKGSDNAARAFVEAHHYSASYPAARERGMLYDRRTGSYVGRAFASKVDAVNDGDEHEIAVGTNLQHHYTSVREGK